MFTFKNFVFITKNNNDFVGFNSSTKLHQFEPNILCCSLKKINEMLEPVRKKQDRPSYARPRTCVGIWKRFSLEPDKCV